MTRRSDSDEPSDGGVDFSVVLLIAAVLVILAALTWEIWMPHS